jgi:iron complex outermembrane recepter protein
MRRNFMIALVASTGLMGLSQPVFAQQGAAAEEASDEDIVVTGTLIRGIAPVGSQTITIGQDKLLETGSISTNELLGSIPQVSNYFNTVPAADLAIAVNQIQISRPNLRNIGGSNAASSPTLILVDGHRIATAGVSQASVDPEAIATGAIERVDVVTEGGSATYGADAVAGTINFVTLRRFDGVKVGGSIGFAKGYKQYDASATVGKAWDDGSVYLSYTYAHSDPLYGRQRSYIRNLDYSAQPYVGLDRNCNTPNVSLVGQFSIPGVSFNITPPTTLINSRCDLSDSETRVPEVERHGVTAGFSQDLDANTKVDIRAFYTQRESRSRSDLDGIVALGAGNPARAQVPPAPPGVVLPSFGTIPGTSIVVPVTGFAPTVAFNLSPLLGPNSARSDTFYTVYGANIELTRSIGENWDVRALFNWSESNTRFDLTSINTSRLVAAGNGTTAATAFNPFNLSANSPALIADLIDNQIGGQAKDSIVQARLIASGSLFEMPGGDVKLAVGAEYFHDRLDRRFQSDIRIGTLRNFPFTSYRRNVKSIFGELFVPVISDGDGGAMLSASAAVRHDKYSDFGTTTNPKFGLTFAPIPGIKLRGNWGTSFTAPTPLDKLGEATNTFSSFPIAAFVRPGDTPVPGSNTLASQGSRPNLQPQTADTWSVGLDVAPEGSGLRGSVSYFDVNFSNILGTPTPSVGIFTNFPGNVITNGNGGLSQAQLQSLFSVAPNAQAVIQGLAGAPVYQYVDFRVGNFGRVHVKGMDFNLGYQLEVGSGSVDFNIYGVRQLSRKQQPAPGAPVINQLRAGEISKLQLQSSVGFTMGGARAQVTWNHSQGYNLPTPTTSVPVQTRVKSFNTVDAFLRYDFKNEGILNDFTLSLNVRNLLNQAPPVLLRNQPNETGYANGFTLGRMFILGISKKF